MLAPLCPIPKMRCPACAESLYKCHQVGVHKDCFDKVAVAKVYKTYEVMFSSALCALCEEDMKNERYTGLHLSCGEVLQLKWEKVLL